MGWAIRTLPGNYQEAVEALFAVSCGVKFAMKRGVDAIDYGSDAIVRVVVGRRHVDVLARRQVGLEPDAMIMQPE